MYVQGMLKQTKIQTKISANKHVPKHGPKSIVILDHTPFPLQVNQISTLLPPQPRNVQIYRQVPLSDAKFSKETKTALYSLLQKYDAIISKNAIMILGKLTSSKCI